MATTENNNPGELLHSINLLDARSGDLLKGADVLRGKVAAVAIGPHWLPMPLRQTLASLSEHLDELKDDGKPVEFVYVAVDRDEKMIGEMKQHGNASMLDENPDLECFNTLIKQFGPGWLAVPFENAEAREKLLALRDGFFGFAFVGENGETLTKDGLNLIYRWGAEGFPYSGERIEELEKLAEEHAAKQTLSSVLVTPERDFVIKNDGTEVKVSSFEGKVVGLYFSGHWCGPCRRFTPQLKDLYHKLSGKLEIVFVSEDRDEASFQEYHNDMPWLAIPFSDTKHRKYLDRLFTVEGIPALVFLDEQGKTSTTDGVDLVFKHAAEGFPFTAARLAELQAIEEHKRANQTIETLLVTGDRDDLLSSPDGNKVKVSELVGKTVGLYFSAHWCPPCRSFTPVLVGVYNKLKSQGKEFEVVFISSDRDEEAFMSYYSSMPWLAVPFTDRTTKSRLSSYFEVEGIPTLVIVGPDGKTVSRDGRSLISSYHEQGFPYTEEHLKKLEEAANEAKEVKIGRHPEHPLVLLDNPYNNGGGYGCDICGEDGSGKVYHCGTCSYDAHPHCVKAEVEADEKKGGGPGGAVENGENGVPAPGEGWVCEGGVCKKA